MRQTKTEQRRPYERPGMTIVELQQRTMLLAGSPTDTNGEPTYNGFNDEEDW